MNGQPWYFIVVRAENTKEQLAEIKNRYCPMEKQNYRADFLQKAPVIIVVCVDKQKSYDRKSKMEFWQQRICCWEHTAGD